MKRLVLLCVATIATSAAAQSADAPLDLRVPEQTAAAAATDAGAKGDPPGVYHGDTSGKPSSRDTDETAAAADDGKAKVWGSFTTGIGHTKGYGTSHYNAAEVNVSKSFGDGERPNAVNLQIRVEQGDGPGFGGRYPYPYFDREARYPPR
jgi:opacity protein-like surface antigen